MPSIRHRLEADYKESYRTARIASMFDVPVSEKLSKEWDVEFPIEGFTWNIGLIVGPSGSGKTTLSKVLFPEAAYFTGHKWSNDAFVNDYPESMSVEAIAKSLNAVGFSSPPSWFLPYNALSNGQKFRADLSRALCQENDLLVFDEFTSVVDRTVATIGCAAVSKAIKASGKQFVGVSCHYDIIEWLEPDWVYYVDSNEFTRRSERRPSIHLNISKCKNSVWRLFRDHHYLTGEINNSAECYLATIDDKPVAFTSFIHFPHPKCPRFKKIHRTVVLPDYQGIGIGSRIVEEVAERYLADGYRVITVIGSPLFIRHRAQSPLWVMKRKPSHIGFPNRAGKITDYSGKRITASFEFVGRGGAERFAAAGNG